MGDYKRFIQNQLKKAKNATSEFIASRSHEQESVELDLDAHEKLREMAEAQNATVQELLSQIVEQYFARPSVPSVRITANQKEENPLLLLDALCVSEDKEVSVYGA